jgi:hypothetical protein
LGLREQATLWQAKNSSYKIVRHICSNAGSGVQTHTGLGSDSQPVAFFLKFLNGEVVDLIVTETNSYQQKVKNKLI